MDYGRVNDVDDLKELLRTKADEMRLDPEMPPSLRNRSRRRRAGNATLVGVIVLGLGVAAFAGAQQLINERPIVPRPAEEPPPPPLFSERFSALVFAGSDRTFFRADELPLQAATALLNGAGLNATFTERPLHASDLPSAAKTMVYAKPAVLDAAHVMTNHFFPGAEILTSDEGSFDIRVSLGDDFLESQETPLRVFFQVDQFLIARRSAPEAAQEYLSSEALAQYTRGENGLSLEAYAEEAWLTQRISALRQVGEEFITVVDFPLPTGEVVQEMLRLRRGDPDRGEPDIWIIGSARRIDYLPPLTDGELAPPPVEEKRFVIQRAAVDADWRALEALIDPVRFEFSFGSDRDPIDSWKRLEREGTPVREILATLLSYPGAEYEGLYMWPTAAVKEPKDWTEEDLDPLQLIYSEKDIERMKDFDSYYGWRVGIELDGDWIFFLAGD